MSTPRPTRRFLVSLDAGMSTVLWWVWADSATRIRETVAEVGVRADAALTEASAEQVEVVEFDAIGDHDILGPLCRQRQEQRQQAGFGALVGRGVVYLRMEHDGDAYLMEIDPDGTRTRQVEVTDTGESYRTTEADYVFNPPLDLYDPQYALMEIEVAVFDQAWAVAVPDPGDRF
ncbi:hypothetical protein [Actinokineospora cianjurensis]|uniref:hypothetical protein n=1 Tax=Actinokineospora cianjurensis TaxID=585224 RepID=UPI000EACE89A|nr:hypothetical protein [Actinokineospora cianjurensis]